MCVIWCYSPCISWVHHWTNRKDSGFSLIGCCPKTRQIYSQLIWFSVHFTPTIRLRNSRNSPKKTAKMLSAHSPRTLREVENRLNSTNLNDENKVSCLHLRFACPWRVVSILAKCMNLWKCQLNLLFRVFEWNIVFSGTSYNPGQEFEGSWRKSNSSKLTFFRRNLIFL